MCKDLAAAGGGVPHDALIQARDMLESWSSYVPPYFAEKHGLKDDFATLDKWIASSPQPEAAQLIEWTDKDGVKHHITINGARELLHKFYDEWPGGWSEVEAEQRARAEAAPAVAQVHPTLHCIGYVAKPWGIVIEESPSPTREPVYVIAAAPEAPAQADNLTAELQQRCSDWGVYWRAPDAHGVVLTVDQATELLRDALGVEVEIKESKAAPSAGEVERELLLEALDIQRRTLGHGTELHLAMIDWALRASAALSHKEQP